MQGGLGFDPKHLSGAPCLHLGVPLLATRLPRLIPADQLTLTRRPARAPFVRLRSYATRPATEFLEALPTAPLLRLSDPDLDSALCLWPGMCQVKALMYQVLPAVEVDRQWLCKRRLQPGGSKHVPPTVKRARCALTSLKGLRAVPLDTLSSCCR
jgi:hypothetical protein